MHITEYCSSEQIEEVLCIKKKKRKQRKVDKSCEQVIQKKFDTNYIKMQNFTSNHRDKNLNNILIPFHTPEMGKIGTV